MKKCTVYMLSAVNYRAMLLNALGWESGKNMYQLYRQPFKYVG